MPGLCEIIPPNRHSRRIVLDTTGRLRSLSAVLLVLLALSSAYGAPAKRQVTVAVLQFRASGDLDSRDILGSQLAAAVEYRLAGEAGIVLTERRALGKLVAEHKLAMTGLIDERVQAGKLLQAEYLVTGDYLARGDKLVVNMRMLSTESGQDALVLKIEGPYSIDFFRRLEGASGMLAAQALGERVVPLQVTSSPEGAQVLVDGAYAGDTPLGKYLLPPRRVAITVTKENYLAHSADYDASASGAGLRVHADLPRNIGASYPFRVIAAWSGLPSDPALVGYRPAANDRYLGYSIGFAYYLRQVEMGAFYGDETLARRHNIRVFGQTRHEDKTISLPQISWQARYLPPIVIAGVQPYIGGGVALVFYDEKLRSGSDAENKAKYAVSGKLASAWPLIGLEFFANFRVALRLEGGYAFMQGYAATNGVFNPLGPKRFSDTVIQPDHGFVALAARLAF